LAVLGGIALVAVWLGQWELAHSAYQVRVDSRTEGKRWDYHRTGNWLAANTDDTAQIAAVEIGIIGYLSQRPILDSMGLVSPEMRKHLSGWSDTLVYALTSFWPQYTIVLDNSAWEGILPQWWFSDFYAPIAQFGNATVYARTGTPELGYTVDIDVTYASGLHLAKAAFDEQLVEAGGDLDVWLRLGTGKNPLNDYQFTLQLVDSATADRIAPISLWPYAEYSLYPASHWTPDDVLDVPFRYPVPHKLAPGTYRLGLLVYDGLQSDHVPALPAGAMEAVNEVFLGWLRIGDPPLPEPLAKDLTLQPVWAEWDGGIVLEQLAIPAEDPAGDETVPVDFVWRAAQPSDRDLITFVHLLNHHGEIVAQQDRRPFHGRFPTPSWRPDERLVERYVLTLPAELPEGSYSLRVGLYDDAGRLPLIQPQRQDSLLMENVLRIGH
jgi:hypothetical protein